MTVKFEGSLWLFCLVWRLLISVCYDQSTVHTQPFAPHGVLPCSAHMCTVWGINRVMLRISIWFLCHFAWCHVVNRAVTLLLLLRRCMKSFSAFCSESSRPLTASVSRNFLWRAMFTLADQLCALNRDSCSDCYTYLSHAVHWCVPHYRQAVGSELYKIR